MVLYDDIPAGEVPPPNEQWDTVITDNGYDRIAKKDGSGVTIAGINYKFRMGAVLNFTFVQERTHIHFESNGVISKTPDQ